MAHQTRNPKLEIRKKSAARMPHQGRGMSPALFQNDPKPISDFGLKGVRIANLKWPAPPLIFPPVPGIIRPS
jgi:hypothetical protein